MFTSVVRLGLAFGLLLCACDKGGDGSQHPPQPKDDGLLESMNQSGQEIGEDVQSGLEWVEDEVSESMGNDEPPPAEEPPAAEEPSDAE